MNINAAGQLRPSIIAAATTLVLVVAAVALPSSALAANEPVPTTRDFFSAINEDPLR